MKDLLHCECDEVLADLAGRRTLLAFDFDGTLAPIVANRNEATLTSETRRLLKRLCRSFVCAVISGRAVNDVSARLSDVPMSYILGNHGMEPGWGLHASAVEMKSALDALAPRFEGLVGVEIESKTYSLAVHYREAQNPTAALVAINAALADLPMPLRVTDGKFVKNIMPANAPHKGDALLMLMQGEGFERTLFVGDDDTDEDAFRMCKSPSDLSVRVGFDPNSAARYFVHNQASVDTLLARLLALRDTKGKE